MVIGWWIKVNLMSMDQVWLFFSPFKRNLWTTEKCCAYAASCSYFNDWENRFYSPDVRLWVVAFMFQDFWTHIIRSSNKRWCIVGRAHKNSWNSKISNFDPFILQENIPYFEENKILCKWEIYCKKKNIWKSECAKNKPKQKRNRHLP